MTTEIGNAYEANPKVHKNRFDRMEWAGAFGDLGELFVNKQRFDVYVCPRCGSVELFIDGIGEEMRSQPPA